MKHCSRFALFVTFFSFILFAFTVFGESEYTLALPSGWNLISFPVNKCFYEGTEPPGQPDCVEKVDIINDLGLNSLAGWFNSLMIPSNAWQMVIGTNGAMDSDLPEEFHSLKYLSPVSGYWVKIKEGVGNAFLSLDGPQFNPDCPIPLQTGWNLVGCPIGLGYYDTESEPVGMHIPGDTKWVKVNPPVADFIFRSIEDKYELIIGEAGAYNPGLPPDFSSLHFVAPGYSYWIKMKESADLIYQED